VDKSDEVLLTTLGLISVINDFIPVPSPKPSPIGSSPVETPPTNPSSYIYLKHEEIDYHYLHKILSALSDSLYDIYYEYKSAKKLWTILDEEYGLNGAEIKRFTYYSSFNKFMIIDSNISMINFMNFKIISDTFNQKETNSLMIMSALSYW